MSVPFTAAEMAAATRRYGYPRGSEFDDGVRVGPTFTGFVTSEVAINTSNAGIPVLQKNCPPLDDCQTVMGFGTLLAPIYSYNIRVNGVLEANTPQAPVTVGVGNNYPLTFVSVSTLGANILNNAITSSGTVTIGSKQYASWDFDWPRTVVITIPANVTAGEINVHGVDMYNQPMTELFNIMANQVVGPVKGQKAFKSIIGVTGSGGVAGGAITLSPSLTTFGLPYYTTMLLDSSQTADLILPLTPFITNPTAVNSWKTDQKELLYTPVEATNNDADVRGVVEFDILIETTIDLEILAYCPGFDSFIKQQIINRSSYGRYQVPVGVPYAGDWVTTPAPAWLVSPQTQYGVRQYWDNSVQ